MFEAVGASRLQRRRRTIQAEPLYVLKLATLLAAAPVGAPAAETPQACSLKQHDAERLACYDAIFGTAASDRATTSQPQPPLTTSRPQAQASDRGTSARSLAPPIGHDDYFREVWGVGRTQAIPLDVITPHRPTYVALRVAKDPNELPRSPTRGAAFAGPRDYDRAELKVQLSFKAELVPPEILGRVGGLMQIGDESFLRYSRLWVAYTQQSSWQIFNAADSRPFRETNYEPELIWTYDHSRAGSRLKLVNLGLSHHSNGQGALQSRSWNRWYVQGGWGFNDVPVLGNVSVLARKWWRVPEDVVGDDNPDIKQYYGRGDVVLRWAPDAHHRFSLLLRHNLRASRGRGFAQLDYSYPVLGQRLHFQASSGYGDSLIDYNHKQTTFGVGVSIGRW